MKDWYNNHIVAGWYRSWAIWVGVLGGAAPYLIDLLSAGLDSWPTVSQAFHLQDGTKETIRLVLLFVVLPFARAWQQRTMQEAAEKQKLERQS